jgi:MFS transporter, NRE family, putaive nickel resistance protein
VRFAEVLAGLRTTLMALRNPAFARLYLAQLVHLLGDALVWVALALLAFELAGERAAVVLGIALTLRVTAFVVLSPFAGVLADRVSRKAIMVTALLARMAVLASLAVATSEAQLYLAMLAMNALTAFFTPTYQASVPAVTTRAEYPKAISLSGATFELLGVLGPGLAGGLAVAFGGRSLFWVAAATLVVSAALVLSLRRRLDEATPEPGAAAGAAGAGSAPARAASVDPAPDAAPAAAGAAPAGGRWRDLAEGTVRLWRDPLVRYGLSLELVASVAGAWILVNSVVLVKGGLGLDDLAYGWVMAGFGAGATLAALALGALDARVPRTTFLGVGALAISLSVLPADFVGVVPLAALWFVAGIGTNWVNLPMLTLLAERTPHRLQGRVYGAHFAWSHLWWLGAYPLAGWLGTVFAGSSFLVGGAISLALLAAVTWLWWPSARAAVAEDPAR